MNKEGKAVVYVFVTIWILALLWALINLIVMIMNVGEVSPHDNACQEIGMKKYEYIFNQPACIDYNNEAHFIDLECKWEYILLIATKEKCVAEEISIGDIRVIGK